jgi:hypothetical protein
MTRQIAVGVVLIAFVNFLMGCSVTNAERVPGDALVQTAEKVVELVLVDGRTIDCRTQGARYREARTGLQGAFRGQQPRFLPVAPDYAFRLTPPRLLGAEELDTAHIAEVVLANRLLVEFESPGGRFDLQKRCVRGNEKGGRDVSYTEKQIRSYRASSSRGISLAQLQASPGQPVFEIVTADNTVLTADSAGWLLDTQPPVFVVISEDNLVSEIPAADVLYASVIKTDAVGSVLATLGLLVVVAGVAVLIALATKQCCPFVYSFDGTQYVFDAEPLGGAICPGLERSEVSRLEHLKEVDGEYRLLVRNEVDETQYINSMRLLAVDAPSGIRVYPDLGGRFYGLAGVLNASSAVDEQGNDLMNFLRASDNVAWQTHLPSTSRGELGQVRHVISVTLPKPPGAKKAYLVTNIGTSAWGSNMIRKTVEYRGAAAEGWLASVVPGSQSFAEMNWFIDREEMYRLKAWMRDGDSWKQAGVVQGQGPLISEDRVYRIDVSGIAGDSLVMRFDPPKGFWTFDYVGVSYDEPVVIAPLALDASRAENQRGASICDTLRKNDGSYYVMPAAGDWGTLRFSVPPLASALQRTIFVETGGFYSLHLPREPKDQMARLMTIVMTPGQVVRTLMEEFRSWEESQRVAQSSLPEHEP